MCVEGDRYLGFGWLFGEEGKCRLLFQKKMMLFCASKVVQSVQTFGNRSDLVAKASHRLQNFVRRRQNTAHTTQRTQHTQHTTTRTLRPMQKSSRLPSPAVLSALTMSNGFLKPGGSRRSMYARLSGSLAPVALEYSTLF